MNETAAKAMNMSYPLGKWVERDGKKWHIVGLVQDFVLESPFQQIQPLFIMGPFSQMNTMHIKLADKLSTSDALANLGKTLREFDKRAPFEYHFIDEEYAHKFADEQRTAKLSFLFAGLTLFISCLGLFGLATYTAERRSKEIGVRKVLGATVSSIVQLLSKDFIKLIGIAFIISCPIAYYMMNSWLEDFNYRIQIGWQVFVLTGALATLITLCTVSFQSIKAALANPVDRLRNE
ncbi:ABC transporter permease [Olivibacter ginsenosidimutans]|uniref:ABC transporter permease n=1 Tax=Olivibacter ginsenosidimutans TaxID=1176537 RepID=UPI0031E9F8F5